MQHTYSNFFPVFQTLFTCNFQYKLQLLQQVLFHCGFSLLKTGSSKRQFKFCDEVLKKSHTEPDLVNIVFDLWCLFSFLALNSIKICRTLRIIIAHGWQIVFSQNLPLVIDFLSQSIQYRKIECSIDCMFLQNEFVMLKATKTMFRENNKRRKECALPKLLSNFYVFFRVSVHL